MTKKKIGNVLIKVVLDSLMHEKNRDNLQHKKNERVLKFDILPCTALASSSNTNNIILRRPKMNAAISCARVIFILKGMK